MVVFAVTQRYCCCCWCVGMSKYMLHKCMSRTQRVYTRHVCFCKCSASVCLQTVCGCGVCSYMILFSFFLQYVTRKMDDVYVLFCVVCLLSIMCMLMVCAGPALVYVDVIDVCFARVLHTRCVYARHYMFLMMLVCVFCDIQTRRTLWFYCVRPRLRIFLFFVLYTRCCVLWTCVPT